MPKRKNSSTKKSIGTSWLPIKAIRKLASGDIQVLLPNGTLSNPRKRKGIIDKVTRMFSSGGKLLRNPSGSGATSGNSEVHSPTSTEVRSPTRTATSTDAYTAGNVTVTGGAGRGATSVHIHQRKLPESDRGSRRGKGMPISNKGKYK